METERSIEIEAPAAKVWAVMVDVERWPEWTASVSSVQRLESGPLQLGATARIRQPGVPRMTWRVTRFDEGRLFSWTAKAPGVTTVGEHSVMPRGADCSTTTLRLRQTGPATVLFGWWMKRLGSRYMEMEACGLKLRSEEG